MSAINDIQYAPIPPARPVRQSRYLVRALTVHRLIASHLYLLFAVFLIWPIWQIVSTGFRHKDGSFTFLYVGLVFRDPVLRAGLWNATAIAVAVTALSLLIAMPLAILSTRYEFRGRGLLSGLLLVPLVLPPFVGRWACGWCSGALAR